VSKRMMKAAGENQRVLNVIAAPVFWYILEGFAILWFYLN